jgi:activator of 2-hydroxyglutaryl-CoA dehydratase
VQVLICTVFRNLTYIKKTTDTVFLGIDSGSTTLKAVAVNERGEIIFSTYKKSGGDIIKNTAEILKEIYSELPETAYIAYSCATGYSERLLIRVFSVDSGEVETVCHFTAVKALIPDVSFILDIGGQDIKCMTVCDG